VFADGANIHVKKSCDEFLRQPDGVLFDANLNAAFSCLRSEDQKFGGAVTNHELFIHFCALKPSSVICSSLMCLGNSRARISTDDLVIGDMDKTPSPTSLI
jgi:hypothetical protein